MSSSQSVDPYLTLRRVERQHSLVETLSAMRGRHASGHDLATRLGVTTRTIERDIERLRISGVPVAVQRGPGGGYSLPATTATPITFEPAEVAALVVSLAALGPSATDSAQTAMNKLLAAFTPTTGGSRS